LWTEVHRTFFLEGGKNRCRSYFFQILDIWSHPGDICDQSRKLSKIALNFGRFFALPNFRGPAFLKLYPCYDPCLAARRMENVLWEYSHYPEVIVANMLNFKPNFKFSQLKFLGVPVPLRVCAIKAWSISNACKNFMAQHPIWAKI